MTLDRLPERLLATARAEFLRYGYDGTDVNRIARKSNLAPTTFYRSFKDKTDVFIAVYRAWASEERQALRRFLTQTAVAADIVDAWVARHRTHAPFRRSVRRLGHEEPRMRRAVAEVRLETLSEIKRWIGEPDLDDPGLAVDLIQFELFASALAENDLAEMGLDDRGARDQLASILRRWRRPEPTIALPVAEHRRQLA